eukprot:365975-Chlamydomonas_euryale.AAC.8
MAWLRKVQGAGSGLGLEAAAGGNLKAGQRFKSQVFAYLLEHIMNEHNSAGVWNLCNFHLSHCSAVQVWGVIGCGGGRQARTERRPPPPTR